MASENGALNVGKNGSTGKVKSCKLKFKCDKCNKSFLTGAHLKIHQSAHLTLKPFTCLTCGVKFKTQKSHKTHCLLHSDLYKESLRCVFCGKGYPYLGGLERHLRSHTQERPYICKICPSEHGDLDALQRHLTLHNANRKKDILCSKCGKGYYTVAELKLHEKRHQKVGAHKCPTCHKDFKTSGELRSHSRVHSRERPYSCNICNKRFSSSSYLKTHYGIHTGENRERFECKICPWKFRTATHLKEHVAKAHDPLRKREFECELCHRRYFTKKELTQHIHRMHSRSFSFPCNLCTLSFKTAEELKNHQSESSDINGHYLLKFRTPYRHRKWMSPVEGSEDMLQCIFCRKSFKSCPKLNFHILQHIKEKHFLCALCPYETSYLSCLRSHLATHKTTRTKDYVCSVCGKSYFNPGNLWEHSQTHLNKKRFRCHVCGKEFHIKKTLNRHILIHAQVKQFCCNVCGKRFAQKDTLRSHIGIHTGEYRNRFSCQACPAKFSILANLRRHMKAMHNPRRL